MENGFNMTESIAEQGIQLLVKASETETFASICALNNTTDSYSCKLHALASCVDLQCNKSLTALVFPLIALCIGCVLKPITKFIRIPYTLALLSAGMALGAVGCATDLGLLTVSLQQWVHLNPPDLFFYIFLAPLIFEAALNADWHVFRRLLIPIFTAAFPIVIAQTGLIAAFTKWVTAKTSVTWPWWSALMFGAMLSATDPISVTATLKELGASEYLGTLIEGESLVNDGSAFVLWEVFFHNALGEDMLSVQEIILKVFLSTIGGISLGIVFALVTLAIMTVVYDEFEVETSLTVIVAFLGFWTAQSPAHLSGVIANVAAGLTLSAYGKPLISKSVRHSLSEFWELLGWIANTIVFIHAGVLTIAFVWPCPSHNINYYDYLLIFAFYAFLQVIRIGLFAVFLPFLSWKNKWLTWKEDLVVGFSGLRGSVSLVLALNVAAAKQIDVNIRDRVQIWTTGVVFLSLFVNGLLISKLLSKLGLDKPTETRGKYLNQARAILVQETLSTLDKLVVDIGYRAASWKYVIDNVLPSEWLQDENMPISYADAFQEISDSKNDARDLDVMRGDMAPRLNTITDFKLDSLREDDITEEHGSSKLHKHRSARLPKHRSSIRISELHRPSESAQFEGRPSRQFIHRPGSSLSNLQEIHRGESPSSSEDRPRTSINNFGSGNFFPDSYSESPRVSEIKKASTKAEDKEVRRRVLISLLSYVRALSNTTFTEFAALKRLEEDVQHALDENEENDDMRPFELFTKSNIFARVFAKLGFKEQMNRENIISRSVLFFSLSETLKKNLLDKSSVVKSEVEQMYKAAAFGLNILQVECPMAFKWIHSQFAIHKAVRRQNRIIQHIKKMGLVDDHEYEVLYQGLVEVRRKHSIVTRYFWKGNDWKGKDKRKTAEKSSQHPIFQDFSLSTIKKLADEHTHTLESGETVSLAKYPLIFVVDGQLRYRDGSNSAGNSNNSTSSFDEKEDDIDENPMKLRARWYPRSAKSIFEEWKQNKQHKPSEKHKSAKMNGWNICSNGDGNELSGEIRACKEYWAFGAPSTICAQSLIGVVNIDSEEVTLSSKSLKKTEVVNCGIKRNTNMKTTTKETTKYIGINLIDVHRMARNYKSFREEIIRSIAHKLVLDTVSNEELHNIRQVNAALDNSLQVSTKTGRAFKFLERLPYMHIQSMKKKGEIIQGPGLLVNGSVKITVTDSNAVYGNNRVIFEKVLKGPAILPSAELTVERANGTGEEDEESVYAHVLVEERNKGKVHYATERSKRWRGEKDTVDTNGRFRMNRHISISKRGGSSRDAF